MNTKFVLQHGTQDATYFLIATDFSVLPEDFQVKLKDLQDKKIIDPTKLFVKSFDQNIIVNIGETKECVLDKLDKLRIAVDKLINHALEQKYSTITVEIAPLDVCRNRLFYVLGEIIAYNQYNLNRFKLEKSQFTLEHIHFVGEGQEKEQELQKSLEEGLELGKCINQARFLVDEPANKLYPETLAEYAEKLGKEYGFDVDIKDESKIKKLGMKAFLAVSSASNKEPKLIVLKYKGNPDSEEYLGLVGKGITYDSGGLSIKPTSSMITMKTDMAGAAAVIATFCEVAKQKRKINICGVVASCENLISGSGYKPGDIVETMSGKQIFIANTDAEGRLTLADALHYIITKENVKEIIDLATLTGAAIVALGNMCSAVITNDKNLKEEVINASRKAGERLWELPNFDVYKNYIKHPYADLTNTSSASEGTPGTITAGQFLEQFVGDKAWVHIDIAGTAFYSSPQGYYKIGASGFGVKTLVEFIKNRISGNTNSCSCK